MYGRRLRFESTLWETSKAFSVLLARLEGGGGRKPKRRSWANVSNTGCASSCVKLELAKQKCFLSTFLRLIFLLLCASPSPQNSCAVSTVLYVFFFCFFLLYAFLLVQIEGCSPSKVWGNKLARTYWQVALCVRRARGCMSIKVNWSWVQEKALKVCLKICGREVASVKWQGYSYLGDKKWFWQSFVDLWKIMGSLSM